MGLERVRAQHPEAQIFLIEPHSSDSILFMENILNYGSRVAVLNYGYRSTARQFRADFDSYRRAFAAHGIRVSLDSLREDDPWESSSTLAVPPIVSGRAGQPDEGAGAESADTAA